MRFVLCGTFSVLRSETKGFNSVVLLSLVSGAETVVLHFLFLSALFVTAVFVYLYR